MQTVWIVTCRWKHGETSSDAFATEDLALRRALEVARECMEGAWQGEEALAKFDELVAGGDLQGALDWYWQVQPSFDHTPIDVERCEVKGADSCAPPTTSPLELDITPGEWHVRPDDHDHGLYYLPEAGEEQVDWVDDGYGESEEEGDRRNNLALERDAANARLMSAAPELTKVAAQVGQLWLMPGCGGDLCELVHDHCEGGCPHLGECKFLAKLEAIRDDARAALKLAREGRA